MKPWQMTKKQQAQYIADAHNNRMSSCFKCGHKPVEFFDPQHGNNCDEATLEGYCPKCGQSWLETYRLEKVEGLNPEPE